MSGQMTKVAADAVVAALRSAGPTLRKLASENDSLREKNAELAKRVEMLEQKEEISKLAHELSEKHLTEGRTLEEVQTLLLEKAASGELSLYKRAVEISAQRDIFGVPSGSNNGGTNPLDRAVFGDD